MAYLGVSPSNGVRQKHTYTATASQTSFSGAGDENITLSYKDSNYVDVYQNGVKLSEADYTATTGTTVVLATGATVSDMIEIVVYDVFSVADTVSKADGGQFDGNVTMAGTLGVTGAVTANAGVVVDNITIDGTEIDLSSGSLTIDSAGDIILDAADGIITSTAGTSNVKLGDNAGNSIQSGGDFNILIGDEAGTGITTGDSNICVGHGAGDALTTGTNNVAIGHLALSTEDEHGFNVAVGHQALFTQNAGQDAYNVAIGYLAGKSITTGAANTILGGLAGDVLDVGALNVALGFGTLTSETKGSRSTAVGYNALSAQNFSSAADVYNTAVGYEAGTDITTGSENTLIGGLAGDKLNVGDRNVALGVNAISSDTKGSRTVAIGHQALDAQNFTSATNSNNVAVGYASGASNVTGTSSTFVGESSGLSSTASFNTFFGANAGETITSGEKNTIIGRYSGNAGGLDIRTSDNNIVLSDGDGNPRSYIRGTGLMHQSELSGVGRFGTGIGVTVADDASITISGAQAAFTSVINVYETSAGTGGSFFAVFRGGTTLIAEGISGDCSTSDTDGKICVFKSSGSHTITFKNRLGGSRLFYIAMYSASS